MKIKRKARLMLGRLKGACAGLFARREKKVVFDSFRGRQYSDNPRAISEKLHAMYPDYRIVWAAADPEAMRRVAPDYVEVCRMDSMRYLRERASATAFVRNEAMTEDIYKKKGQMFIQTWHGDRGVKRILYDAWAKGARPEKVMDGALTDLFVVGSDYAQERIKSAFDYHGRTLKVGCPRNDCLVNPLPDGDIRRRIGIREGQKVLLYAPTLRKGYQVVHGALDIPQTLAHLKKLGGDWVCLIRAHPKSMGLEVDGAADVIDVSQYPDMSDLLMIADALVTDYSSCAGDFILRGKPLLLAQFDREQYTENERSFFLDIDSVGFLIAHSQDELNGILDRMNEADYRDNCARIAEFFGVRETGGAAEAVCRAIDAHHHAAH